MKVAEILKRKGSAIMSVKPTDTIGTLAQRLRLEKVGAMIVSSDDHSLDGIISERDVVYGLAAHGNDLLNMPVSELMTKGVVTCSPDDNIADVAKTMTLRRVRHLPVKEGGQLVGIVSIGDVLKHRLDEMQLEANVLRDYAVAGH